MFLLLFLVSVDMSLIEKKNAGVHRHTCAPITTQTHTCTHRNLFSRTNLGSLDGLMLFNSLTKQSSHQIRQVYGSLSLENSRDAAQVSFFSPLEPMQFSEYARVFLKA